MAGLFVVLVFHAAVIYSLWSGKNIPTSVGAVTLMAEVIIPSPANQPKSPQPNISKPHFIEPAKHPSPIVEAADILPMELMVRPPVSEPVVVASPPRVMLISEPVKLTEKLPVICPDQPAPNYPLESRSMNEQGKVLLLAEVEADGKIFGVTVKVSSGFSRLDEAALNTVKTWHCQPQRRNGLAVNELVTIPLTFNLGEE